MTDNYIIILERIQEKLEIFSKKNSKFLKKNEIFGEIPENFPQKYFEQLMSPCNALIDSGGKRWRPVVSMLFFRLLTDDEGCCDEDFACTLACVLEMVHSASLIHDDIEDGAVLRRGKPCCHVAFGEDVALNAGSFLYFYSEALLRTCNDISDSRRLEAMKILNEELCRLHLGQAMDIFWHRNSAEIPTSEEYGIMVRMKTGTLARLAFRFAYLAAGKDPEPQVLDWATDWGYAFQIKDDVLNLTAGNPGKSRGDDIVEGKKSLPVLLYLNKVPENLDKIISYFNSAKKAGIESPSVESCIRLLEKSGAIDEAREIADSMLENTCIEFEKRFPENPLAKEISQLFRSMG